MNWLAIVLAAFLLLSILIGIKKGLLKQGLILGGAIILLGLMTFLLPFTKEALREHTAIEENISIKVDEAFAKLPEGHYETKKEQTEFIENSQLPGFVRDILLVNNNSEIYERLGVEIFQDYVKAYLTDLIVGVLAYIGSFLLAFILYRLILLAAHLVDHLPLAHGLNHALGGLLGLLMGLLIICIFFLILLLICESEIGQACYACIEENPVLTFVYEHNPLLALVSTVTG